MIGKKIIWKDKEFNIIDTHNTSDFVIIDDEHNSIVGLHWDEVEILNQNKEAKIKCEYCETKIGEFWRGGMVSSDDVYYHQKDWICERCTNSYGISRCDTETIEVTQNKDDEV